MKTVKNRIKYLAVCLSVVIVVAITAVGCGESGPTKLQLGSNTATCGDTVKLDFTITGNTGLCAGQVKINYDANAIEFVSCAKGEVFDECEVNSNKGSVNLIVNDTEYQNIQTNGLIATLNFKVKVTAPKGSYDIVFDEKTNFSDEKGTIKEIAFENGNITVK